MVVVYQEWLVWLRSCAHFECHRYAKHRPGRRDCRECQGSREGREGQALHAAGDPGVCPFAPETRSESVEFRTGVWCVWGVVLVLRAVLLCCDTMHRGSVIQSGQ